MATSQTYAFAPSIADLFVNAYGRCQIRRAALTTDHLKDAAMSANFMQVDWANATGVPLWTVELATEPLLAGVSTYAVDPDTTMILSAYIRQGTTDRLLTSQSRDEYASIPDKTSEGYPTLYWYQKLASPQITLWKVPDADATYTLYYYRARQPQDATVPGGIQPEVPYRYLEAYVSGLAVKLAEMYAPAELGRLTASAAASWERATRKDVEDAPWFIGPMTGAYTRGLY